VDHFGWHDREHPDLAGVAGGSEDPVVESTCLRVRVRPCGEGLSRVLVKAPPQLGPKWETSNPDPQRNGIQNRLAREGDAPNSLPVTMQNRAYADYARMRLEPSVDLVDELVRPVTDDPGVVDRLGELPNLRRIYPRIEGLFGA